MTIKQLGYAMLSLLLGTRVPRPIDTTSQEVGLPHLLRNDPDKLYELCRDQILQMTDTLNGNVVYMREIKNTIYFTAGTFLTVALPVIGTSDYEYNHMFFYSASLILLVSFLLGITASLKEQKLEHKSIIARRTNWELAKMCILTNELPRTLELLNQNRSNQPTRELYWKYYWLITTKDVALILFFCGVFGILVSLIIK